MSPAAPAKRTPFVALLLALVVGAMALLLALNTASAANEVSRHDAAVQDDALTAQLVDLQNQVNASAAPANIARVAQNLGMVPAVAPAFLRIESDGRVSLLGSPAAVTAAPAPPAPPKPKLTPAVTKSTPAPTPTPTPTPTPQSTFSLGGGAR